LRDDEDDEEDDQFFHVHTSLGVKEQELRILKLADQFVFPENEGGRRFLPKRLFLSCLPRR
jgi:hypothetical protein